VPRGGGGGGALCGDGTVNGQEECDPGIGNFGSITCCTLDCKFKLVGKKCGNRLGACYTRRRCRKQSRTSTQIICGASTPKRENTACRIDGREGYCDGLGSCKV
jgi:hypothetical protein